MRILAIPLMGGRGNQYFQMNAAIGIAKINRIKKIYFLVEKNHILSAKSLDLCFNKAEKLGIEFDFLKKESTAARIFRKVVNFQLRSALSRDFVTEIRLLITKPLLILFSLIIFKQNIKIFVARDLGFSGFPKTERSILIVGYFQSIEYGDNLSELFIKRKSSRPSSNHTDVMIHIRQGDYRNNPNFGILAPKYYRELLIEISQGERIRRIDVYSDDDIDTKKLKEYIGNLEFKPTVNLYPGSKLSDAESFQKMANNYNYYLIANSTFSYWAAVFGENAESVIFYPSPWFKSIESPNRMFKSSWRMANSHFLD